ncbi:MAG: hypothetical protein U5K55_15420 [Aliarcobacter sp.]|nr:hypothetical protein [Aliarcobacter sp.]
MNDNNIIYAFIALTFYIAFKKYTQYKVLKLVQTLLSQKVEQIIDVRSVSEFNLSNKEGSINIPTRFT